MHDPATTSRPVLTLTQRVARTALGRWTAKLGLAWVGVVVFCAGFAPLLASSYPILWQEGGAWSSPMLQRLSVTDAAWLVGVLTLPAAVLLRRYRGRWRYGAWLGVIVLTAGIAPTVLQPPPLPDYERYRAAQPEFALWTPVRYSPNDRVRDRIELDPIGPWWAGYKYDHWLGQNDRREDVASRMVHACRIVLSIGLIATGIAGVIGVVLGGLMGYFAGVADLVGMRLVEVFEFIPQLLLLLMFVAFFPGDRAKIIPGVLEIQRLYMIMLIIGLTSWTGYARFVRAEFLKLRKQDFVTAAHALGLPLRSVLFRHMLPNGVTPVLVSATFGIASAILSEATLSFLGLGLNEEPSWGQLLNQATRGSSFIWWIATFPGLAIFLTVFACNLLGESLRDAIDPYTQ